ncbi:sensor histidine kinase [Vibrio astriarenae]
MKYLNTFESIATLFIAVLASVFFAFSAQYNLVSKLENAFVNYSENLVVLKNQSLKLHFNDEEHRAQLASHIDSAVAQLEVLNKVAIDIERAFPPLFWLGESNLDEVEVYYKTAGEYLNYLALITDSSNVESQSSAYIDEETMTAILNEEVHYAGVAIHEHLMSALFTTSDGVFLALASIFGAIFLIIISLLYRYIKALKSTQTELEESLIKAEQASHAKSLFLSSMTHEFRTPMNGVLGIAELLKEDERLEEEHRENVKILIDSGTRLLTLLEDVLTYSTIEQGRTKLVEHPFTIPSLIYPLESIFREECSNKGITFDIQNHLNDEDVLLGDQVKIRKVIFHLLSNAIKFTRDGCVELRLDYQQVSNELVITVTDSGIGIDESIQRRIFEAFEQGDGSFSREYEGAGLGLTIVNSIAACMDGNVELNSDVGKGTRFTVRLHVQRELPSEVLGVQAVTT